MTARRHAATACSFILLAVLHTWPLALAPGRASRVDNGDYSLNAWALAWVVHQAPRDPRHLFDANIFFPERNTLAFSEHLVPQAVFAAPVIWAGGSAVLAYNLVMLAGFALSGWAMAWLITRWTGHWTGGLVAGSIHAFNAHTMTRLAHVQALHVFYLPIALFALDRLFSRARVRDAIVAGLAAALQSLTSGYWLVFTLATLAASSLARVPEWWRRGAEAPATSWRQPVVLLGGAALVAGPVVAPFLYPYWLAREQQGLVRSLGEVTKFSAGWLDYITSASRLYMATPLAAAYAASPPHDTLFPGVVALLLAGVALATGVAWRDARARMLLATGAAGLFLSLGPVTLPYRLAYDYLPLLQGIRAPSRFGIVVIMAVAGLAGFGVARLDGRLALRGYGARARAVTAAALLVAVNGETVRAPLWYKPFAGIAPIYRVVDRLPPESVLAEFPMYQPRDFYRNADYMLGSTVHWRPLVNGYSGFQPRSYRAMAIGMRTFPDPTTADLLRRTGVTHVIVHRDRLGAGGDRLLAVMAESGDYELVAGYDHDRLFRLLPR